MNLMPTYTGRPIEDLVPTEKRNHHKYRKRLLELQSGLEMPEGTSVYSTHEAGHHIFWKRAGFNNFEFHGPTVFYDVQESDENNRYKCYFAAVRTPELNNISNFNDDLLNRIAESAVAGDTFNEMRNQIPTRHLNKNSDYRDFSTFCEVKFGLLPYDIVSRWQDAIPKVRAYLQDPRNEENIQTAIKYVRRKCFHLP